MDPLIAVLMVVVVVLTALLVVVGIQVIMILKQVRQTLEHANRSLDAADSLVHLVARPFSGLGDTLAGLKSGLKLAETFVGWLKENQERK